VETTKAVKAFRLSNQTIVILNKVKDLLLHFPFQPVIPEGNPLLSREPICSLNIASY
jgi:hypothetical protein